jgi:N,N-dimethylformamidase
MTDQDGMKIFGYTDPMSAEPGEVVRFMVSSDMPTYQVDIVRLIQGDDRLEGPGFKEELVEAPCSGQYSGRVQAIHPGSYVEVANSPSLAAVQGITVSARIWPTMPARRTQAIVTKDGGAQGCGFRLTIGHDAHLEFSICITGRDLRLRSRFPLQARHWYFVAGSYDAATGLARLVKTVSEPGQLAPQSDEVESALDPGAAFEDSTRLLIGAAESAPGAAVEAHFSGKIDSPRLFNRGLVSDEVAMLRTDEVSAEMRASLVASWDFSVDSRSDRVIDTSGGGHHGRAVNAPMRGVTGWNWDGTVLDHTRAPHQYGAIYFHEDDLEDAKWEVDFALRVPEVFRSGVYAARLRGADGSEDYIPFFVRAPRSRPSAPILVVMPTFTYLAYANEHFHNVSYVDWSHATSRPLVLSRQDQFAASRPDLGPSLYDLHPDGSPSCYSSRRRPIVNMRPKVISYWNGAARHFGADLYLIDWLEHEQFSYDVATDEDLDEQGTELLDQYSVVLTGTHPEYASGQMVEAVRQYLDHGGQLMYLGGNGFWWVTSRDPDKRHIIEVRKEDPTGVTPGMGVAPGEHYHSTTGEPGGFWRLRGHGPEKLFGTGFASQGFDRAEGYRRQPDSHDPRVSFVFEGVESGEIIGNFGLALGGAAGDEFDHVDFDLGSPENTLILASSSGHNEYCLNFGFVYEPTEVYATRVRSDIAFYETPSGGAVFSVGSMCWCASLSHNTYTNNVARITRNVLNHFLEARAKHV